MSLCYKERLDFICICPKVWGMPSDYFKYFYIIFKKNFFLMFYAIKIYHFCVTGLAVPKRYEGIYVTVYCF